MAEERHGIEVGIHSPPGDERKVIRNLDEIKRKTDDVGKAGDAAGKKMGAGLGRAANDSGRVGRSIDGIKAKAKAAGDAGGASGDRIASAYAKAASHIDKATFAAARLHPPLRHIEQTMGRTSRIQPFQAMERSMPNLIGSLSTIRNLFIGMGAVMAAREIAQSAVQFKGFDQALTIITGSASAAREEMEWAAKTAGKLGFRVRDITQTYVQFAAASKGTRLEGEEQRHVYESITRAAAAYGLTNEQLKGSLLAVQQMIGKGTVSAEELRGQLGERLPGAVQIAARAMGITTQALFKMMEQGQLTSDIFLQRFANQLDKEIPQSAKSANSAFNAFLTQLDKAKLALAKGGLFEGLTKGAAALADAMKGMADNGTLAALGNTIGKVIQLLGENINLLKIAAIAWGVYFAAIKISALTAYVLQLAAVQAALGGVSMASGVAAVGIAAVGRAFTLMLGPIGIVVGTITAIIAAWMHFSAVSDATDQVLQKANSTFRDAADELGKAKHWGDQAAGAIKGTGTDSASAGPLIKSFAGEVGNAADQLYRLAKARQADYVAQLEQKRQKASLEYSEAWGMTSAGRGARAEAGRSRAGNAGSPSEFFGGIWQSMKANAETQWFGQTQDPSNQAAMARSSRSMEMLDEAIKIASKDLEHFVPKKDPAFTGTGKPGAVKRDPNAEVGKDWRATEVAALLRSAGFRVTGTDRTAAQQQAQIDKWNAQEAVKKGSGGIHPAAVGTSPHERGKGVDIGREHSIASISAFLKQKGIPIKQLLNEGDHKHLGIGGPGSSGDGISSEIKEQIRLAETRKRMEGEFWASLQAEVDLAKMLPEEAEKHNRELDLRKILNDGELAGARELLPLEKARLDNLIKMRNEAKFQGENQQELKTLHEQTNRLLDQQALLTKGTKEEQEDAFALEERMWGHKQRALNDGLKLTDDTVQKALEELAVRERTNIALARKNMEIQRGNDLVDDLLKESQGPARNATIDFYERRKQIVNDSTKGEGEKKAALDQLTKNYSKEMQDIAEQFADEMMGNVRMISDGLGGVFGDIIGALGGMAAILQQQAGGVDGARIGAKSSGGIAQALSGMSGIVRTIGSQVGASNTPMGRTLGKISAGLGKAAGGAAMGAEIAGLAKAIGYKKFSTTGAQVGGAIGSFLPIPGGQIIGSIVGGVIGGLFKKTKSGSSTIGMGKDGIEITGSGGNSKNFKEAAKGAGNNIIGGLNQIAEMLGGSLGSFGNITIGQRHGDWRVNATGTSLKKKKGARDFDDDEAAAVTYAIFLAIKKGAITGLSDATSRVLKQITEDNMDATIKAAMTYEGLVKQAALIADPIKGAFSEFIKGTQRTMETLKKAGYTYEELMGLQSVFAEQQKQMLVELTKGYRAFLEEITKGPNSGKTIFAQFQDAYSNFNTLKASSTTTQDQFTEAGSKLFDLARQVYGSATPEFEAIKAELVKATEVAIDKAESGITDALNSAGIITAIGETNGILGQILAKLYNVTPATTTTPTTPTTSYTTNPVYTQEPANSEYGYYDGGYAGGGGTYGGATVNRY